MEGEGEERLCVAMKRMIGRDRDMRVVGKEGMDDWVEGFSFVIRGKRG